MSGYCSICGETMCICDPEMGLAEALKLPKEKMAVLPQAEVDALRGELDKAKGEIDWLLERDGLENRPDTVDRLRRYYDLGRIEKDKRTDEEIKELRKLAKWLMEAGELSDEREEDRYALSIAVGLSAQLSAAKEKLERVRDYLIAKQGMGIGVASIGCILRLIDKKGGKP